MKKVISFVLSLALAGVIGLTAGCKKEEKKPTNATANVTTNVTANVTTNATANVTTNATANVTNATKK